MGTGFQKINELRSQKWAHEPLSFHVHRDEEVPVDRWIPQHINPHLPLGKKQEEDERQQGEHGAGGKPLKYKPEAVICRLKKLQHEFDPLADIIPRVPMRFDWRRKTPKCLHNLQIDSVWVSYKHILTLKY